MAPTYFRPAASEFWNFSVSSGPAVSKSVDKPVAATGEPLPLTTTTVARSRYDLRPHNLSRVRPALAHDTELNQNSRTTISSRFVIIPSDTSSDHPSEARNHPAKRPHFHAHNHTHARSRTRTRTCSGGTPCDACIATLDSTLTDRTWNARPPHIQRAKRCKVAYRKVMAHMMEVLEEREVASILLREELVGRTVKLW